MQGVIAAKDEARRRGLDQLEIGFNWAYRARPRERGELLALAARPRRRARSCAPLDWIGLDAYPGTVFPPAETRTGGYRDGMVNAMSTLRCFAAHPGHPASGADEGRGERLAHRSPAARDADAGRACSSVMVRRRPRLPRHLQRDRLPLVQPARRRHRRRRSRSSTSACSTASYVREAGVRRLPAAGGPPRARASRRRRGGGRGSRCACAGAAASTRAGARASPGW